MALNLPTGDGGNRVPIIKYDARAGRVFRVDRSDATGTWESVNVEIVQGTFQAVIDLENIETGWLSFPTGGAPDIRTVKMGSAELGEKPGEKYRPGFRVYLKLGKSISAPGIEHDVREMASNAKVSIDGMSELHTEYAKQAKDHPGQLPVVTLERTIPIPTPGKDAQGRAITSTNYQPVYKIVRWIPRPAELSPASIAAMRAPTTPAASQTAAQPDMAEAEEF